MTGNTDVLTPAAEAAAGGEKLRIGQKLKTARKAHRLSIQALATRVGCSESLISKIENDRVFPSLPMLHRITTELGTSVGNLFAKPAPQGDYVARKGHRPMLSLDAVGREGGVRIRLEALAVNGALLYGSIHIVDAGGDSGGAITHIGEELGYVLEGEIEITLAGKPCLLKEGDSIFFPSDLPHSYRNPSDRQARILWVNTPPTF
jgi:transcriptional regulator with XRE-family HTH domain/mannose-6-phosphate isomerase-like protein (cupin superfamily)